MQQLSHLLPPFVAWADPFPAGTVTSQLKSPIKVLLGKEQPLVTSK